MSTFTLILFRVSHLKTFVRFEDIVVWIKDVFEWSNLHKRLLSSANKVNLKKSVESGKSFIKIKNRIGPKMDPCGTPWVTDFKSESVSLIQTYCLRSDRYELNQSFETPRKPYLPSFDKRSLWSMQSNALLKSKKWIKLRDSSRGYCKWIGDYQASLE